MSDETIGTPPVPETPREPATPAPAPNGGGTPTAPPIASAPAAGGSDPRPDPGGSGTGDNGQGSGAPRADGTLRFAVEDLLAAGAIIDALSTAGIDHQSPEAAAAASAYTGLKNATRHLISASASSREARESSGA